MFGTTFLPTIGTPRRPADTQDAFISRFAIEPSNKSTAFLLSTPSIADLRATIDGTVGTHSSKLLLLGDLQFQYIRNIRTDTGLSSWLAVEPTTRDFGALKLLISMKTDFNPLIAPKPTPVPYYTSQRTLLSFFGAVPNIGRTAALLYPTPILLHPFPYPVVLQKTIQVYRTLPPDAFFLSPKTSNLMRANASQSDRIWRVNKGQEADTLICIPEGFWCAESESGRIALSRQDIVYFRLKDGDDMLTGGSSVEEVIFIANEVSRILKSGVFTLRKWVSNSPEIMQGISSKDDMTSIDFGVNDSTKTLGLIWNDRKKK
ncbi:hypothetical protein NQ318_008393 [Aromia moschata]|uniref:Uncharacterized protein n=1 Tax=Aromia moschata TaxID=1265417 RepID=A0AAV8YGS6_9CUCU|nr:hypothetical protein NQ318_008393 [Aromia moschata]